MCSKCSDSPSHGFNKVTEVLLFTLFVSCDIDLGQVIILTARAQVRAVWGWNVSFASLYLMYVFWWDLIVQWLMFGRCCAALFASGAVSPTPSKRQWFHDIHSEPYLMLCWRKLLHTLWISLFWCHTTVYDPHYISVTVFSRGVNEEATFVLLMQILMPFFMYVLFLDKSALWMNPLGEKFTVIIVKWDTDGGTAYWIKWDL